MTPTPSSIEKPAPTPEPASAVAALAHDSQWQHATEAEREVLHRIAMQRDRLAAGRRAKQQAQALQTRESVPSDAPLAQRLAIFAKLHPVATAAVAGVALVIGPRKLIRYGGIAWPLINRFRR